jgi:hypothetical protein
MKQLLFLLATALLLTSCSTVRQLERAERLLAAHPERQPLTPDTVRVRQLLAANPKLAARVTRTVYVVKHDTVRLPAKNVVLLGPPINVAPSSRATDSLMRLASRQVRAKDSLTSSVQVHAALAARPKNRADTLRIRVGDLLIQTWIDRAGAAHTTTTNLHDNTVVVQPVVPAPKVSKPQPSGQNQSLGFWAYVGTHFWTLLMWLLIGLLWLVVGRRQRRRPVTGCVYYGPYSHKS